MDYKLIILKQAEKDLDEILDYKSKFYAGTADRFMDELEKRFDNIAGNPYICQKYIHDNRYLRAVVMDYLLFYRVIDKTHTVKVYRILHGKRNIDTYL